MHRSVAALLLALLLPLETWAQGIPIKTVPVAEGHQFLLFPSRNLGMGSVSIALDDPLHDPFVNPARGVLQHGFRFSSAPVFYGFSSDGDFLGEGSGRTLPVGMLARSGRAFFGGTFAWQELTFPQSDALPPQNLYGFATGGFEIPGTGLSVGLSAFGAALDAVEGVRLLYAGGNRVRQDGGMALYRAGLFHRWNDGRTVDLIVLHHRFEMTHRLSAGWWGGQPPPDRTEHDETRGWAVQAGYRHPLAAGWQVGAQVNGDWKWHPKIPNYDLMQIPRDPGHSWAYRLGVGLSRDYGQATFAADLVYEPIWSNTWADALEAAETSSGGTIAPGEKTIENDFRFDNTHLRLGVNRSGDQVDFSLGLNLYAVRYDLFQQDYVAETTRDQAERWAEWTFSTGLGYAFPEFTVRYLGLLTLGTGQPGTVWSGQVFLAEQGFSSRDFLVAPNGDLTLRETRIFTHQVSVILPLSE